MAAIFSKTAGYAYIKLQKINYWNQALGSLLGLCAYLGTLKFLKLLRFNKKISYLASTLGYCLREIVGFSLVFLLIWLAFVQLMFLVFYQKLSNYSTFVTSMETSFEIMLGKFDVKPLLLADSVFGPLLFCVYNLMIVMITLNIFISIINDSFEAVRRDTALQSNEFEVVEYILGKISAGLFANSKVHEQELETPDKYKDSVYMFPVKIDKLVKAMKKV